jgi:hypothetical protein
MKAIIHSPAKFYKNPADAELAATMAEAEDGCGWKYVAVHCPKGTGFSFINIFDEDGEFVGKLF